MEKDFYKTKKLSEFSDKEWEAVCMRCGMCCLTKYSTDQKIYFTNQMCENFDFKTGKCSCYKTRLSSTCVKVDMRLLTQEIELLPPTCAYRLLFEGKELPKYHPLVSGKPDSVHKAKKTVLENPRIYSLKELKDFKREACRHSEDYFHWLATHPKQRATAEHCRTVWLASYEIRPKHKP